MTKKELVELLNKYPDDATIEIWEPYTWGESYPLDGELFKYDKEKNKIIL